MAFINRYSAIDKAILVATGNSLVMCGSTTETETNTSDMITTAGNPTRDWTLAGSTAQISILQNSTILYAELIWYSTVKNSAPTSPDVQSVQDQAITFITPLGSNSITPQNTESYTATSGSIHRFRSAVVTDIITYSLGGTYTVSGVPTSMPGTGLSDTAAGWTLVIVYRNDAFVPQRISFSSGINYTDNNAPIQTSLTGFTTPNAESALAGRLFLASANGQPLITGESLKAGNSFANLSVLGNSVGTGGNNLGTSPNNPYNNIFAGQINVCDPLSNSDGLLNITGSNGSNNHDAFVPTQVISARNKWDMANLDLRNALSTTQTQVAVQYSQSVSSAGLEWVGMGSQVSAIAPNLIATLVGYDVDGDTEYNAEVGEQFDYVVQIKNLGNAVANNVIISSSLDANCTFIPNTVLINGILQPGANITTGINLGSINPGGVVNVVFEVRIVSRPVGGILNNSVQYSYQFISGAGSPTYTNIAKTNKVSIIVQTGNLSIVKTASVLNASINDTVTYTSTVTNIGSEAATSLIFQDKVSPYCAFVARSVTIDGVAKTAYDPNVGFALSDLQVGESTTVSFEVTINSLSPTALLENTAYVTFNYLFNQYLTPIKKTIASNTTEIQIQYIDIVGNRWNNNNYPNVGDSVTYTLTLTNIGNISAANVLVKEPDIPGASFEVGSVTVNGISNPILDPFVGFTLATAIAPQATTTITYGVQINELQPGELIENIAQVPFKYQIQEGGPVVDTEVDSNKVITRSNFVVMTIPETVDKAYATVDDILYYSVNLTNTGNIDATNTIFQSYIQTDTSFVPNSVAINGVIQTGYNPNTGFSVGTIAPGDTINVKFRARVLRVPTPNVVYNQSQLTYDYQPDPNGNHITSTVMSNTVQTIIDVAQYTIEKTVDKDYARVNDYLVYTTSITNTGTVDLTNVSFADNLASFLNFVPHTVYIDGVNYPDYDPNVGFELAMIHPTEVYRIIFGVQIMSAPPVGYVLNTSHMTCTYQENPTSPVITETTYSNSVRTEVVEGNMSVTKLASKSYAALGDTITYSFNVANTGTTSVENVRFIDNIPTGATLVAGSVVVNGISKPDYNPNVGFNLGEFVVGQVQTIQFDVIVNSIPQPNRIINNAVVSFEYYWSPQAQPISKSVDSNAVTTIINKGSATLTKQVNKAYAAIGDTLVYTVTATNTGTVALSNVGFIDLVQAGATFITDSVKIDGIAKPGYDPNVGFLLDDIAPGGDCIVNFSVTVTSLPIPPQIDNTAQITYRYYINPNESSIAGSSTSNTVTTYISQMIVTNTKTVDKVYATIGNTLTYTSQITNFGNVDMTNTNFTDNVPVGTTFVAGSVSIDGINYAAYDPNVGFALGTLTPNQTVTVVFNANVTSVPVGGVCHNTSDVSYDYKIDPTMPSIMANALSNTVTTYIKVGQLAITKAANRQEAKVTDVISYSFILNNLGNTPLSTMVFQDAIQVESSFNTGTVTINGTSYPSYNPNTGFSLDNMQPEEMVTIGFDVTVNSIPQPDGKLYNTATTTYNYYIDPNAAPISGSQTSNTTQVTVKDMILSNSKTVDKTMAKVGDILTFSVALNNEGTTDAQSIVFTDIVDSNLSFNTGSVTINATTYPLYNPNNGFTIPDVSSQSIATITFTATVMTVPTNNIAYNTANIQYQYTIAQTTYTVNTSTNTTQTYIAVGALAVTKAVDKAYATVSDSLLYTVNIQNTGSVDATNIYFGDSVPIATSFTTGTVIVGGVSQPTYDPVVGFSLPDLPPYQSHEISFGVSVDSLPISGNVQNTADVTFSYQLTPTDPTQTVTTHSNTVTTDINLGKLSVTKIVDKAYATLEDQVTYSFTVTNSGNVACSNIMFLDTIQSNALFNAGSVIVNGVSQTGYNPNTGFALGDIAAGQTTTISFAVTVKTLPGNHILYNAATVNYSYYIDPTKPYIMTSSTSNTVSTYINVGSLAVTKSTSKAYATLGDVVVYTINVVNQGTVDATTVNFRDVIPTGLTFITDSVTINGVSRPGYNPYDSFTLGTISPGATSIITFGSTVTSVPTPSLVTNTAQLIYSYRINPAGPDVVTQVDSNAVTTQINLGSVSITKAVDKAYTTIGEQLTYSFIVANTGNVVATNIFFTDGLQSEVSFNSGSVMVNGLPQSTYDPATGFSLGSIAALDQATVSFTVTVNPSPTRSSILNYAVAGYSYNIDPNGNPYTTTATSNTVSTRLINPKMAATKVVDLAYATLLDYVNYTIVVSNTGNAMIRNVFFNDFLSNGAVFTSGSVVVNNVSQPTYDPVAGFTLPDVLAGDIVNIQFAAQITSVPVPPQVTNYAVTSGVYKVDPQGPDYQISATTNTVSTQINVGNISNVKSVNKDYANVGDNLTYTSVLTNTGNVTATNVWFFDTLQNEISFIPGTVRVGGVVNPTLDPTVGFNIGALTPTQSLTIDFDVTISTLPTPPHIDNKSQVEFSYKINPNGSVITQTNFSNTVTTQVVLGQLAVTKTVDKGIATIGDELTYTVQVVNTGNVIANSAVFQDIPSTGATFKAGSVVVNGTAQPSYSPITGFSLGDIGIGMTYTVVFVATVVSVPVSNIVTNQAVINFTYLVDPKQPPVSKTNYSNLVTTNIALGNLSVTKAVDKQFATIGEYLTYTVVITNVGNINATNVLFVDPTPLNAMFVLGSVRVNGTPQSTYNPATGFPLNTMTPGQIITVVYQVQVIS